MYGVLKNYPNQDDYDTEEEYLDAERAWWDNTDAYYDAWKDDKLTVDY